MAIVILVQIEYSIKIGTRVIYLYQHTVEGVEGIISH